MAAPQPRPESFLARKRRELASTSMIDIMSWVFPLLSAFATYTGMDKLMGQPFPFFGALIAFMLVGTFYRLYLQLFPAADGISRVKLIGPMILFALFAICLTTPFSTATFGGDIALRKNFEETIRTADQHGRARLAALESEQSLAGSLEQSSTEFLDLAKEESGGAFTGVTGHGSAAVTFETIGQQLDNLHSQVAANKPKIDELKAEDTALMRELRNITYERGSQQQKVADFAAKLNELKDLFDRMGAASIVPTVQQAAGSLTLIAGLQTADGSPALAARQSVTIGKAQTLVGNVQAAINKAASTLQASNTPMPPLEVMDESKAIFVYGVDILWAWALALTLDFAPMLFLYILTVRADMNNPKKGKRRSTARKPIATVVADQPGVSRIRPGT